MERMLPLKTLSVLVTLAAVLYTLPSPLDPYLWRRPFALPTWNEEWTLNDHLLGSERLAHGLLHGPESIALHPDPFVNEVFASVAGGLVVQVAANGSYVHDIFFVGGYLQTCAGNGLDRKDLLSFCKHGTQVGNMAWNESYEVTCGRPLGLRTKQLGGLWYLFVLDAYHGLFRINLDKCGVGSASECEIKHIFNGHINVHLPGGQNRPRLWSAESPGASRMLFADAPKFFNDFDISSDDGCVYFTDSSFKWSRSNNRIEILDGAPRGRVIRYCGNSTAMAGTDFPRQTSSGRCLVGRGRFEVLMCGLHFPNGLQITKQGDILVAETTRFRIIKINISAVQDPAPSDDKELRRMRSQFNAIRHTTCHGRPEIPAFSSIDDYLFPTDDSFPTEETGLSIFIDALPGAPDNIRENPINHHITIGLGVKSTKPFSLLHFAYQHIGIRHLIGKLIPMRYLEHLVPKYGLVLVSKSDGTPVDSYHDPSGRISMISEAQFHPVTGDLWMGSHSNEFIGVDRVNKDKARIQSILSEQDVEMERYYVENRAIFKSWKEQEDKEQLERMRYLESNQ